MTYRGDCRLALRTQAASILSAHSTLAHRWGETPGGAVLVFPSFDAEGFDVTITAFEADILVAAGRMHSHFDWHATAEEACTDALGFVRDLLSPAMRLVEESAGGSPYRWRLERFSAGQWQHEETYGLFVFNYLGQRSRRIFQNKQLPSRSAA